MQNSSARGQRAGSTACPKPWRQLDQPRMARLGNRTSCAGSSRVHSESYLDTYMACPELHGMRKQPASEPSPKDVRLPYLAVPRLVGLADPGSRWTRCSPRTLALPLGARGVGRC